MSATSTSRLAFVIALVVVLATGPAWSQTRAFKSGEWTGSARRASDGTVQLCQASNRRPDEYPRLYVGMDADGEAFLAATDKHWGPWKEGATVPVTLAVDGRSIASLDADVVDQRGLAITLDRKLLTTTVLDGSSVAIETTRGTVAVPVNGIAELFTALEKCIAASRPHSNSSVQEATANARITVLTCQFGNRNSGREALSCNSLTGFSLECEAGAHTSTSSTMTVSFDEQNRRIIGRGQVDAAKFTDTEIAWKEPLGKDGWRAFVIERFSGAITMYGPAVKFDGGAERKIAGQMTRLATGACQVAKDRLF